MKTQLLTIFLAFFEGIALTISPCIFPVLPIILLGSLEGNKKKPLGIIIGFIGVFALFTLLSRKLVMMLGIDLNIVRNVAFILLFIFGVIMIFDYLALKFDLLMQRLANIGTNTLTTTQRGSGFSNGLLLGGLIGFVWTPCAGPILAAVILQTILQQTSLASIFTLCAFSLGVAIPMLAIVFLGREIKTKLAFIKDKISASKFKNITKIINVRKILGIVIIFSVWYMYSGFNFSYILPQGGSKMNEFNPKLVNAISSVYPAPEISGISGWINSEPLQLAQLHGKVVLIDFWTYSCINCIRTFPYLKDWYAKYHNKGFEIVGIHSPEFDFEKKYENVLDAVKKYGLNYPVALDNNFSTWQNFHNNYWPAHYLIDREGNVVYQHFGEGKYDETEHNIRVLLGLVSKPESTVSTSIPSFNLTPETYLGYEREEMFSNQEVILKDLAKNYDYPVSLSPDGWALKGKWIVGGQKIVASESSASIKLHFHAKKVYAVMGSQGKTPIKIKLSLNGKTISNTKITVLNFDLYTLLEFTQPTEGVLEITSSAPGLEIYTFTFG